MEKKEQKVYFTLQGKHSYGNVFVIKIDFSGMSSKNIFWLLRFLYMGDGKPTYFWVWPNLSVKFALFSSKVPYFITVSIVFSVYKQNFKAQ